MHNVRPWRRFSFRYNSTHSLHTQSYAFTHTHTQTVTCLLCRHTALHPIGRLIKVTMDTSFRRSFPLSFYLPLHLSLTLSLNFFSYNSFLSHSLSLCLSFFPFSLTFLSLSLFHSLTLAFFPSFFL